MALVAFGNVHHADSGTMHGISVVKEVPSIVAGGIQAFYKTRNALLAARNLHPSAEWFFKFDDDAYVYTYELVRRVNMQFSSEKPFYGGYPVVYNGIKFASGGAGYILSSSSLQVIKDCASSRNDDSTLRLTHPEYEDFTVGECMHKMGKVAFTYVQGMHPHHPYQMIRWDKNGHPSDRVLGRTPVESYMNPISYHYMQPAEILRMHDDVYLHGFPRMYSTGFPRTVHQFWEGPNKPALWISSCKTIHAIQGWEHLLWDRRMIASRFPVERVVGQLESDGLHGELINQDFFKGELNLLSDIFRHEALLLWGGMYLDADTFCFRPVNFLLEGVQHGDSQGFAFFEKDKDYFGGLIASGVMGTRAFSPLAVTLVAELLNSNWNDPPWISAGPMHLTRVVRKFMEQEHALPHYLSIKVFPSHLVYPYHHSNSHSRPEDIQGMMSQLISRGAVMDQMWSTTKTSYKNHSKQVHWRWAGAADSLYKVTMKRKPGSQLSWQEVYTRNHVVGTSTLARFGPRWVVAALHPSAGICNRIMHLLSTLSFALATGRVLLFDWVKVDRFTHEDAVEVVAHADFLDIFEDSVLDFSYERAKDQFSAGVSVEPGRTIGNDDTSFLGALSMGDLDVMYPESIIRIERYDWWAPLLDMNPLYNGSAHGNISFAELFKFLLKPKNNKHRNGKGSIGCDWMLQQRTRWDRQTAPIDSFIKCARDSSSSSSSGMSSPAGLKLLVTTDSAQTHQIVEGMNDENVEIGGPVGCRDSIQCDRDAISSMYRLSECKSAVLTAMSTFGSCIAGLSS